MTNITKYIAFLRSVELGNITQAAIELDYSQSAVSKMIQDLEREWDVKLITRTHSGVELSSEGLRLIPMIRGMVQEYENLNFAVSEIHGLESGILRLGSFTSFSTSMLPGILKGFRDTYPGISVQLHIGEYTQIASWLEQGKIDCGILDMEHKSSFDMEFLFRDDLVAIVPKDHPMAGARTFPVRRIAEERFIILREMMDFEMSTFLKKNKTEPALSYEVNSDFTLLSMVESGLGVSIVHRSILYPTRFNVVMLPLDKDVHFDVGMAIRKSDEPPAVSRIFMRFAKDAALFHA